MRSAVSNLIDCYNSITKTLFIKSYTTSKSFFVADFQQSNSISIMAEIMGCLASINYLWVFQQRQGTVVANNM